MRKKADYLAVEFLLMLVSGRGSCYRRDREACPIGRIALSSPHLSRELG